MKNPLKIGLVLIGLLPLVGGFCAEKPESLYHIDVSESFGAIQVKSSVPYPPDQLTEDEARQLSQEAAVTQAKDALLTHILSKTTKSNRPLSVAEVPSLDLQKEIREMASNAEVKKSTYKNQVCTVWVEMDKKRLKKILKAN